MGQFDGKTALITGAGSGIGRATARLLASAGAAVVVADVAEAGGRETVRLVKENGGKATFVRADVTSAEQVAAMVQGAVEAFGGMDILHANAGVPGPDKPLVAWSEDEWEQAIGVNLTGVFLCCRAAIPAIAQRGGGAIVITASVAGIHPTPLTCAYNASKAGAISLTKTLAMECAPLGIRVNAVAPGEVDTPMSAATLYDDEVHQAYMSIIPMQRIAQPEDIARAVLYLASDAASYVTGEVLTVDGGVMAGFNQVMALLADES